MFRRKSAARKTTEETPEEAVADGGADEPVVPAGPYDEDEAPESLVDDSWVDLGSLLVAPAPGKELRLQVDENTGEIASVLLAAEDGALELRAFAAPRGGDLWSEALPMLRSDVAQRGGVTADREGPWGPELVCQMQVELPDGQSGVQPSRIIGVNGPRWMLRATLLGRPAVEVDEAGEWEQILASVVVRRGREAKPKGEALDVVMPANARRVEG